MDKRNFFCDVRSLGDVCVVLQSFQETFFLPSFSSLALFATVLERFISTLVPFSLMDRSNYCWALTVLAQFLDVMAGNGKSQKMEVHLLIQQLGILSQMVTQVLGVLELF